ncbi:cytochrome c biogenesis protein CcdA [Phenylobacterium sp.]|uniref:cytochrome c biogenesis protein DipZ n=1 Tax=Phenylobacterium sp. TaxID=1871053 RepID=UPI00301C41BD
MLLLALAYLGGALTIVSPCILPVLPFVFARAEQPFLRSGLPLLIGMALTFAGVASLAAVGGGWAVHANAWGRNIALLVLAGLGLLLLFPKLADLATRPLVALGARISETRGSGGIGSSLLLGAATGLLWAPCAGPILGLVLAGAALQGANAASSLLLLAYALGAATSLGLALLVGGRVFAAMKRSLGAVEWMRRGLGLLVLAGVAAIALGLDTGLLTRLSLATTAPLEQSLLDRAKGAKAATPIAPDGVLPVEGQMPSLDGAVTWLNSPPLTTERLRGKVVLVDFWTYSCINCLRSLPYVRAWAEKYKGQGLVVIGVHTPEFAFERDIGNVRKATRDLKVGYPVAVDNDWRIWRAFRNNYWPAHYFIDGMGRIRHHHFGEGQYDQSERVIQRLLAENGRRGVAQDIAQVATEGASVQSNLKTIRSPETYLGYEKARRNTNPGPWAKDVRHDYTLTPPAKLNDWSIGGAWTVGHEDAALAAPGGRIVFRFHARDLNLVLGPAADGRPVRFRIRIDGRPPGGDHGVDVDATGAGQVGGERLYQLVRQAGPLRDRTFEIEFLDAGVHAYAFTFG